MFKKRLEEEEMTLHFPAFVIRSLSFESLKLLEIICDENVQTLFKSF